MVDALRCSFPFPFSLYPFLGPVQKKLPFYLSGSCPDASGLFFFALCCWPHDFFICKTDCIRFCYPVTYLPWPPYLFRNPSCFTLCRIRLQWSFSTILKTRVFTSHSVSRPCLLFLLCALRTAFVIPPPPSLIEVLSAFFRFPGLPESVCLFFSCPRAPRPHIPLKAYSFFTVLPFSKRATQHLLVFYRFPCSYNSSSFPISPSLFFRFDTYSFCLLVPPSYLF